MTQVACSLKLLNWKCRNLLGRFSSVMVLLLLCDQPAVSNNPILWESNNRWWCSFQRESFNHRSIQWKLLAGVWNGDVLRTIRKGGAVEWFVATAVHEIVKVFYKFVLMMTSDAMGMPFWLGFCNVAPCLARNLLRYQYRLMPESDNDLIEVLLKL